MARGPAAADDGNVLEALASRHPSAFMRVYDRFATTSYSHALKLVGRAETAEAVIEDVFLALWRNPEAALAEPNGLHKYLADAVHRRALNQLGDG